MGFAFKTKYLLNKYFKDFPQQFPTYEPSKFIMHPILVLDSYLEMSFGNNPNFDQSREILPSQNAKIEVIGAVSYTHLTLPTT